MLDAILRRRSIRHYQDRPVSAEQIEQLQEAMLRSPSSRNLQPWRFVFVTDRELLRSLSHARPAFADWIADAPLAVVICADAAISDCWIEDASIAAATLQLAATDLGLGSCWTQIRGREHESGRPSPEYVREVLELPYQLRVLCMVAVGHPAEDKPPKERASLSWDSIETR